VLPCTASHLEISKILFLSVHATSRCS
jgi:hypothetical protein